MITRSECLDIAKEIVCKDREGQYGSPENNFGLIASLWSEYIDKPISAEDVAMMMALLKIARIKMGKYKADSYVDLAGYAACACELRFAEAGKTCDEPTEREWIKNNFTDDGKMVDSKNHKKITVLNSNKIAIHCDTKEKAEKLTKIIKIPKRFAEYWNDYKQDTCYSFEIKLSEGLFAKKDEYEKMGYTILEFDDFDWSEYGEGK